MVLPFGPGPVVETHGRSGYEPHPPNFTFGAAPGLIWDPSWPSSGFALLLCQKTVFIPLASSSTCDEEDVPVSITCLPPFVEFVDLPSNAKADEEPWGIRTEIA